MHGGRRDSEVLLHFGLRWRTSVDFAVVRLLLNQKTARPKTHKKLFWILPRVSAYFCGTYEDTLFSVAVC